MSLQDPKRIVARGYDVVGRLYGLWATQHGSDERARQTSALISGLAPGAKVLDLGCGVGLPTTRQLARHFHVTGVDISARQIAGARKNVPKAHFLVADMTALDFPPHSFNGIAAFFSVIHVPTEEQPGLLMAISSWLQPGGLFVAAMVDKGEEPVVAENWLGAPMYWSGFDSRTNTRLIEEAGLRIVVETEELYRQDDGVPGRNLWLIARKPASPCEAGA